VVSLSNHERVNQAHCKQAEFTTNGPGFTTNGLSLTTSGLNLPRMD
jgi:hypothetical protein